MVIPPELPDQLMEEALIEARLAAAGGEVPVGAVVWHGGGILARGHNQVEKDQSVVSHAEILALQRASAALGSWRLEDCVLCVTLEPCVMCLGAIRLARIPVVIFGAGDSRQGAAGSLFDLTLDERIGTPTRVVRGIKSEACEKLLSSFFSTLRNRQTIPSS